MNRYHGIKKTVILQSRPNVGHNFYRGLGPDRRNYHNGNSSIQTRINEGRAFIIGIPITNRKSFVYYNHSKKPLTGPQLHAIPWIYKLEDKVLGLAGKGWQKMVNSKSTINQKAVQIIHKLMEHIPYEESSLRSFPSRKLTIRDVDQNAKSDQGAATDQIPNRLPQYKVEELRIPISSLHRIPFYGPLFQTPLQILTQLKLLSSTSYTIHFKRALMCAIGIPVCLPLVLVPIIPNLPGLYLTYRLYCHFKVLSGVRLLNYLLLWDPKSNHVVSEASCHFNFSSLTVLDKLFPGTLAKFSSEKEVLVIDNAVIDELARTLQIPQLKEFLSAALVQESRRLEKQP